MYNAGKSPGARTERVIIVIAWTLVIGAGLSLIWWPGATVERLLDGPVILAITGPVIAAAGAVAAVGVATNHYRWEWVASGIVLLGIIPYVASVLVVLITAGEGAVRTFTALGLLVCFPMHRNLRCRLESKRQRRLLGEH